MKHHKGKEGRFNAVISGLDRGVVPWWFPAGVLATEKAPFPTGEFRKGGVSRGPGLLVDCDYSRGEAEQYHPTGVVHVLIRKIRRYDS